MIDAVNGKTVVITGATGGIGFYSALEIAGLGTEVILIGRNPERAKEAAERIVKETEDSKVAHLMGDVSTLAGIQQLANDINQRVSQIDVLINNPGYLGNAFRRNEDGIEMHFAFNVSAPWKLTHALIPDLKSSSSPKVLNISGGDKPTAVDVTSLQAEKAFKGLMTYTHSKSIL